MKDKIDGFTRWVKDNKTEAFSVLAIVLGIAVIVGFYPQFFAGLIAGAVAGWNKDWIIRKVNGL